MEIQMATGKTPSITVAFRLPLLEHQQAMSMARERGVKLSVVMRTLVQRGLEVEQRNGDREQGE
jgi:hypothetical protein